MSSHGETSTAFLFFPSVFLLILFWFMEIVCSIYTYEPFILETKTSQSSLSFQELRTFVKSQRLGKYSYVHWKGQINSGFNEISFSSCSDDHCLDKCKNRICGKTEKLKNALGRKGKVCS